MAETKGVSILVIEAGPGNPLSVEEIATPALAFQLVESKYDWQYPATLYDKPGYTRFERRNTRGKVLGGSSALNYYTWIREIRGTYDEWKDFGGPDWTWENCKEYFKKPATLHDDKHFLEHDPASIADAGPLNVDPAIPIPLADPLIEAWKSQGHKVAEDIYDGEVDGLVHLTHTIHQGQRQTSANFLHGISNITVKADTMVHRILFEGRNAIGVQCLANPADESTKFFANHEVIISAGVFESPKLLMLSGIGPENDFTPLTATASGLKDTVHSPHVGQNLQDHPVCPHAFLVKDGAGLDHVMRPGLQNTAVKAQYKATKTGPLCSALLEMSGFARADERLKKCKEWRAEAEKRGHDPLGPQNQPYWEFDFLVRMPIGRHHLRLMPRHYHCQELTYQWQPVFASPFLPHVAEPQEGDYLTIVVSLLRPLSRGSVTIRSANANDYPVINFNYLDHPLDVVALREGVRFVDGIILRGHGMRDQIKAEYPKVVPREDDEEMEKWVHERVSSGYRK